MCEGGFVSKQALVKTRQIRPNLMGPQRPGGRARNVYTMYDVHVGR